MVANINKLDAVEDSLAFSQQHYENFPVASFVLPRNLRHPISLIYTFARQADDFADEGEHPPEKRLAMLQGFRNQLDLIKNNAPTKSRFFNDFREAYARLAKWSIRSIVCQLNWIN